MRKSFTILMALVITFFTVPFGGLTALAGEKAYDDIEDGEYEIDVKLLKEGTDSPSAAAGFMKETATLTIEEGKLELTFYIPDNPSMNFNKFELEGVEPGIKEVDEMFHYTFTLNELKTKLSSEVSYEVPFMNLVHDNVEMDIELVGLDELPKVEKEEPEEDPKEPEESEEPETPEIPEEDPDNPEETPESPEEEPDNPEGKQETPAGEEINYTVKHATKDEVSAADSFFTKPATLIERDGETYIQLTITSWSMIDWVRTDQGDVDVIKVNEDNSALVEFKVTGDLSDAILLKMSVTVPGMYSMEHDARLVLEIDDNGKGGTPPPTPTPTPKSDPKPTPKPEPKVEEVTELIPDKVVKYNYVIKHATDDATSAADTFFKKPAHVLYKDGEKYLQFTVTSWSMIDWLRTDQGDITVIKVNDDDSALVQIKIDGNLSDVINLSMHITVPGMYSMEHDARLFLDLESGEEVDPSGFRIVVDNGDLKKPKFGNGDSDENGEKVVKSGKTDNPKTGDTTNIFLYMMLLIGSVIPLAVKLRRRFV